MSELQGMLSVDETGGTGFLPLLLDYWEMICQRGITALRECDCETACYKCLQHFHNQQHHPQLNRHLATEVIARLNTRPHMLHKIPAQIKETPKISQPLQQHRLPAPTEVQYQVDFGNGNYTVADFAWPEHRWLIFIDGTSLDFHGNPAQAKRDRTKRRQARMRQWHIVEPTHRDWMSSRAWDWLLMTFRFI